MKDIDREKNKYEENKKKTNKKSPTQKNSPLKLLNRPPQLEETKSGNTKHK